MSHKPITIKISLDVPLFKEQRRFLNTLIDACFNASIASEKEFDMLIGIQSLLDDIADVAHDKYGLDTLLEEEENEL